MKNQFKRITLTGLTALSAIMMTSFSVTASAEQLLAKGVLDCAIVAETTNAVEMHVEFDEGVPVASINENDHPADYTASHIRIRLAQEGPVLTIGRVTGRALLMDRSGTAMGAGKCQSPSFI